jgi:hypothetical protein
MKVQQELMRHASTQTTMNVYGQALSETKRQVNSKVVRMVLTPTVLLETNEKGASVGLLDQSRFLRMRCARLSRIDLFTGRYYHSPRCDPLSVLRCFCRIILSQLPGKNASIRLSNGIYQGNSQVVAHLRKMGNHGLSFAHPQANRFSSNAVFLEVRDWICGGGCAGACGLYRVINSNATFLHRNRNRPL